MSAKDKAARQLEDQLHPDLTSALHAMAASPLGQSAEFQTYIAEQVRSIASADSLRRALEHSTVPVRPEIAMALAETERFWRDIEAEFGLLTSTQVAEKVGAKASRSYASDARKAGRLIAVKRLNKFLYPGFQFEGGAVRPVVRRLTEIAASYDVSDKDLIYWLCSPRRHFADQDRPVDHLNDPEAVTDAAGRAWGAHWVTVPGPPSPLTARSKVLSKGTTLYRIHSNRVEPNEFNPGPDAPTRFALFGTPSVPMLHAAGDEETALAESILLDVPNTGGAIESKTYRDRSCSRLILGRQLTLASLVSIDDPGLGLDAAEISSTGANTYLEPAHWAEAAHAAGFDGLIYPSAKPSEREAHVLFGDRVNHSDLSVDPSYRWSFDDVDGIAKLITLAGKLRIQVRLPF